ncbi:MAG: hypothetical protein A2Z72_01285 [Omnitrophica bacterium RBG_13_46_9]|nr:MAG: hypothetical protein A2Z72_01285 [Omnitrophica bacterium RBG_13_46_9]
MVGGAKREFRTFCAVDRRTFFCAGQISTSANGKKINKKKPLGFVLYYRERYFSFPSAKEGVTASPP